MALSRGLADTSVFIARETGRPIQQRSIPEELAVSVITIGELRAGVLAATGTATRDRRLSTLAAALALLPVPIDDDVAAAWARLRLTLSDEGLRMPVNDSWIAATAMAHDVAIVTQDDDFPSLDLFELIRV